MVFKWFGQYVHTEPLAPWNQRIAISDIGEGTEPLRKLTVELSMPESAKWDNVSENLELYIFLLIVGSVYPVYMCWSTSVLRAQYMMNLYN